MIQRAVFLFLATICLLIVSEAANATIVYAPNISLMTSKTNDDTSAIGSDETQSLVIDSHVGYVFDENGLYVGGLYRFENGKIFNGTTNGYALGLSVGFVSNGFSASVSYLLGASRTYSIGGTGRKIYDGSGFQLDVAWAPLITPNFGLGPQLSYRSLNFAKSKIGSAGETSKGFAESVLTPGLVLWITF